MKPRGFLLRWGVRFALFLVLFSSFMFTDGDVRRINPAERAGAHHLFSIPGWEAGNFLDKWVNRVTSFLGFGLSAEELDAAIARFSDLSTEIRDAEGARNRAIADPETSPEEVERLEVELQAKRDERGRTRDDLEERLEAEVSSTLSDQGFGGFGGSLWPPVDFRMEPPPHIFVTSPRDQIRRLDSVLLSPGMTGTQAFEIEQQVLEQSGLSGIVLPLGGVATYPTFVRDDNSLLRTLDLVGHEWLHAYLFFNPLGQNINASTEMNILNETIASLIGEELGVITWERLTGEEFEEPTIEPDGEDVPDAFSFDEFMRETRQGTDEILANGDIEGAEAYMESRRIELQEHRYFIRKINQAWFAFNGTYGDSPASVSPIGGQVDELRTLVSDVGDMLRLTRGISSYDEFLEVLEEARETAEGISAAR
ncbi:MAG: hypothetical protein HQ478_05295 [Chloroflexi bacterium]|nr:hypothetical protein [Chloroflexota bacterium]